MTKEHIDKILSGRLWLTGITGAIFAYAVYAKIINSEATAAIIVSVFTSYFNRHDRGNGKGVDEKAKVS